MLNDRFLDSIKSVLRWKHRWYVLAVVILTWWYGQTNEVGAGQSWMDVFFRTKYGPIIKNDEVVYDDPSNESRTYGFKQMFVYFPILFVLTFVNFKHFYGTLYGFLSVFVLLLVLSSMKCPAYSGIDCQLNLPPNYVPFFGSTNPSFGLDPKSDPET